ncbi:type II toxin-antitoxin system Phd/YefM family antitoxin [Methyloraptor flagellatus]|jgi:prevent-host-death family protein|uniref:Antitoxin n=1 Tax=Methyloraptor flagellatus TaxID=3162530 RepID=A0AAU7XC73_9HYPH
MITVGTLEAKNKLSALLDHVVRGEEVVITRHGRPVARLVPAVAVDDFGEIAREITAARDALAASNVTLTTEEIRVLRDEGRR